MLNHTDMVQKNVLSLYFWHPTHARTTRYEKALLPEGKKRPRSLRFLDLASLVIPDILLLVTTGCGLRLPLPALTDIDNSRYGTPFLNVRHEKKNHTRKTHFNTLGGQETWYKKDTYLALSSRQ